MKSLLEKEREVISSELKEAAIEENMMILKYVCGILFVALFMTVICAVIKRDTNHYICLNLINMGLVAAVLLTSLIKGCIVPIIQRHMILLVEILIFVSSIVGGTLMCEKESEIVTFAVMLVFLPAIFYERAIVKTALSLIALILFIILDFYCKEWTTVIEEVPNLILLWLVGIVISIVTMKTRIGNLKCKLLEAEQIRRLENYNHSLNDKYMSSIEDLIGERDENTGGHIKRSRAVVAILADEINKSGDGIIAPEKLGNIVKAAPLHDVGKMAIADAILCKKGKLSDEEYKSMKWHTVEGGKILNNILEGNEEKEFAEVAKNMARFHHERYDGNGYPEGLSADNIPIEARIMAIADVYDALVSKRCYKEGMTFSQAFEIMEAGMGSQFDPELNKYFVAGRKRIEEYYMAC